MKLIFAALILALSFSASARNMIMFWKQDIVHVGNFSVVNCHYRDYRTVLTITVKYTANCPPWIDVKPDMTYETPSWFNRSVIVPTP